MPKIEGVLYIRWATGLEVLLHLIRQWGPRTHLRPCLSTGTMNSLNSGPDGDGHHYRDWKLNLIGYS